jgi:hypothetical protein
MDPRVWGPGAWRFIHCVTLTYPDNPSFEDKQRYKQFLFSLGDVLPCSTCAVNFREYMDMHYSQAVLESRTNFFQFMVDCHNAVNKTNGAREWTYVEALRANTGLTRCFDTKYVIYFFAGLLAIGALLCVKYARR